MQLDVNGQIHRIDDRHAGTPLLWVLRDVLGIYGVKFGCGSGFCAACTVWLDGRVVKSCQVTAHRAVGSAVHTVEGASGAETAHGSTIDAVREAWHRCNVVQCGYCQPGQTLSAAAYLATHPQPDDAGIDAAMSGNLCRCGTYPRIRAAIYEAARTLHAGRKPAALPKSQADASDPATRRDADALAAYIDIRADDTVVVRCSQIEMGQGAFTTLATLVADELDADLASLRVVHAANDTARYANPLLHDLIQVTARSTSTDVYWQRYRQVAAAARARLVTAAAALWQLPAAEIAIADSIVSHPSGRQARFGELADAAAALPVTRVAQPKSPRHWRLIGRDDVLRVEGPAKIQGQAHYTIDVAWPGLLHAVVLHPPRFGARVKSLDAGAARQRPGVVDVLIISRGVAVVAETYYDGFAALRDLAIQWDDTHAETRGTTELLAAHRALAQSGDGALPASVKGDVEAALGQAVHVIEASYDVPYLAAAPMEPNNGACRMREDGVLEVWAGSQAPDYARRAVVEAAGLPDDRVEVHVTFAGGGFGLRSSGDPAPLVEAAEVGRALGWKHPIKVQWPRQEEFKYGCYRPMAVMRLRAGIDATGAMTALDHRVVVQSVAVDMPKLRDLIVRNGVDGMSVEGAVHQPYAIPNHRVELINFESGVHVATMRAVGHTQNEFAREAMIDEAAAAAGVDALVYRRRLLAGNPRLLAVLERAAAAASWDKPPEAGRARGLAVSNSFRSFSVQIAEISQDDKGRVRVDRFVFAIDCGRQISPDFVRAQAEGGILYGLSSTVWDEVVLNDDGSVRTQNFDGYPIARMRDTPTIEVVLIESEEEPGGVGEPPVASVAPALVNAIAALRGVRIRSLPIAKSIGWTLTARPKPAAASRVTSKGERPMAAEVKIVTTQNGPYKVEGSITIHDYDGQAVALPDGNEVYLCRCGASANKPFCDGSHVTIGFDGTLAKQ